MIYTLLQAADWPIVGQIAWVMGKLMAFIYNFLDSIMSTDTGLVGMSMIIYTIIVYMAMLPMTISQQKSQKMNSVMQPEIQAIQKKYSSKKDQASMMKQQEEIQQVYDKYGTSMMSSCLPLLIQMPFLFALFPVVYNMERYVPALKNASDAAYKFLSLPNISDSPMHMMRNSGSYEGYAAALVFISALLIPVLSALSQYISTKLLSSVNKVDDKDNPMASSMKTMNLLMPLMSVMFVISSPAAIGIYWVVSAVVRTIQQLVINHNLKKLSVEDIIEKNREKAAKKQEKRGEKAEKINAMAQTSTRSIKDVATKDTSGMTPEEKDAAIKEAKAASENAEPGSLASKANMVKKFNENK
ncbi:YidC/Oxa1 family membrane protein insertase [Lachnospiraceae bacterium PM6-15]|uniref:Membrane protein insertase YidC n=1 Tax=Ohessyouella blattaphilus TaxID=2949333 RepID=A0ABT1EKV3_9FIRM|nr:membrane protein insertase YidC [Ohessyouella blattaphilus]MCP1111109.1 membrane protein insertase YidC [Ohessyouella blattaphilus]MCR8564503.1 membrane protein insertase YidC [Ohessyouella blattaphilus]